MVDLKVCKSSTNQNRKFVTENLMTKTFTSLVVVEFALNNHEAESKEHYIDILKRQYLEEHDIELQDSEITEIEVIEND